MALIPLSLLAQPDGAELFDDYCADCHSVGDGDMTGPDLLGVERLYSNEWLISFIRSAKTMINAGDAQAVAIYEKYEGENMPDTNIPNAEIQSIIDYIKSFSPEPVEEVVVISDSRDTEKPGAQISKSQISQEPAVTSQKDQKRLDEIENKLDILLEFQRKALAARFTEEEVEKGRQLFEGEIQFLREAPACVSCHNTSVIDTLNWNPSALDIATALSDRSNAEVVDLVVNPSSDKMKELLSGHELTDDESFYITAFLQNLNRTGLKERKEVPVNRITFIVLCFLILLLSLDFRFYHIIKYKLIHAIVITTSTIIVIYMLYEGATDVGLSQNYSPDQPVKFSHRIHIKENNIKCLFCHNTPEYSIESGVPTTNVCMICHSKIEKGAKTGEFEINKVIASFENEQPIEWVKIHNLPDHVFFSHAQHVNVAKIDCGKCHGPIEEMDITRQFSSLSMGWCVQCHRETEVQFSDNTFYSSYEKLHQDLEAGKIDKVTADKIGANDCQKCHY